MKSALPILFIAAAIGLFYTFIDPKYGDIQVLQEEEQRFDDALDRSRELQAIRDSLLAKYNEFPQRDLERLRKMLPPHVDNVRLALDINGVASRYNMRIQNIVATEPTIDRTETNPGVLGNVPRTYGSVTISFNVAAPYENLIAFIRDLERSLRIIDITNIAFSTSEGDVNEYRVSFKTYWMP